MRSILYITYDGLSEALGQSQILAYLKRLSGLGNQILILSYEKEELIEKERATLQAIISENNLTWVTLPYTKKPPVLSTIKDIRKGIDTAIKLHAQYKFQIVHCRGYIPAIIGRKLKKKFGIRFIFDMRGWWADEKKESGFWDGPLYRPVYQYIKKLERQFFRESDYAVSLTYKGKEEIVRSGLAPANKVGVIPTCVDFDIFKTNDQVFKNEMREKLGINANEKVFVYSGSLGGNYDPDTLINVFKTFQSIFPQAYLLILSKDQFSEELKEKFARAGINRVSIFNISFTQVTNYLRAGDVGFIYYKMSFSTIGRSPTKLGEYWASGIPFIAFKGIGDLDYILEQYPGSGILLSGNEADWPNEMKQLQFADPAILRSSSKDYFHIDKGVAFYQNIYEQLVPLH